jgi:hypothetical protein
MSARKSILFFIMATLIIMTGSIVAQVTIDTDGDGVTDSLDNCILEINTDQSDLDRDGLGDICDKDYLVLLSDEIFTLDNRKKMALSKSISTSNSTSFEYSLSKKDEIWVKMDLDTTINCTFYLRQNGLIISKSQPKDKKVEFFLGLQARGNYEYELIVVGNSVNEIGINKVGYYADYRFLARSVINSKQNIPLEFDMLQNYPNPFNGATHIPFELPKATKVIIKLYKDIKEEPLATLVNADYAPGYHSVLWDASTLNTPLTTGQYLYTIEADGFKYLKKMIYLK